MSYSGGRHYVVEIISIISEYQSVPAETIQEDTLLIRELGFSSFDVVSLVGRIEDEFDIEVPDRKIRAIKTADDIVKLIDAATRE